MGVILSISNRHKWVSGRGLCEPFTKTNFASGLSKAHGKGPFKLAESKARHLGTGFEVPREVCISGAVSLEKERQHEKFDTFHIPRQHQYAYSVVYVDIDYNRAVALNYLCSSLLLM